MTTTTKRPDGGELKPCPFCGDRAWFSGFVVQCKSCGASLIKQERGAAIEAWNTRTPSNESPAPQADALDRVIEETGSRDAEDLADMANVGHSLMRSIEVVVKNEGPFKGWSPAQDPAEIVLDLCNALDEALAPQPPVEGLREDVKRWKLVDGKVTTGESVIFDGTFIVAKVTRREDAELILAALASPSLTAGPSSELRRAWLDKLNAIAPAVENLAGHQEQCDFDGVMVKVSRQALDEVLNAVNDLAVSFVTAPATLIEQSGQKDFEP